MPIASTRSCCVEQERAWPAPGCCRSGRGGCCRGRSPRSSDAGTQRSDAAIALDALDRGRRARGEPQAAVGGEALLRGEVVDVDLGRVDHGSPPAAEVASTSDERRRRRPGAAQLHRHAGRGLVVGEGVRGRRRRSATDRRVGARRSVDDDRLAEVRRGGARPRRTWRRTRRTRGAGCARSMSPNVATSQNTVVPPLPRTTSQPSGRREQLGQAGAHAPDQRLHRRLAVRLVPRQRALAAASAVDGFGADLGRPAAEAAVGRQQVGGDADLAGARTSLSPDRGPVDMRSSVTTARIAARDLRSASPPSPNRPRWPSTPRPRR